MQNITENNFKIQANIERRIKQHVYAKKRNYFLIVQPGFEKTVVEELLDYGYNTNDCVITEGGIEISMNGYEMQAVHLQSACITRILMRIDSFNANYFEKLKEKVSEINWELYLTPETNLKFKIKCRHSKLYHTDRIEEECRKGITQRLKNVYGDVITNNQFSDNFQTIFIRFGNDRCTVSLDCTGEPLYKRNIRTMVEDAPVRETLAALVLREAGISNYNALLDPMCGSGVFLIEAGLISEGVLPNYNRHFTFEGFPLFNRKRFDFIKKEQTEKKKLNAPKLSIYGSDIYSKAVTSTLLNLKNAGFENIVNVQNKDIFMLSRNDYPDKNLLIVSNPPYGERLGMNNILEFHKKLGNKLRNSFKGDSFALIVHDIKNEKALNLKVNKKIPFFNGGIPVSLIIGKI